MLFLCLLLGRFFFLSFTLLVSVILGAPMLLIFFADSQGVLVLFCVQTPILLHLYVTVIFVTSASDGMLCL